MSSEVHRADPENNRYASGASRHGEHAFIYCPDQPPVWIGTVGALWVLTTDVIPPFPRPFTQEILQGSFDQTSEFGWTSHYEWNFEPIYRSPSPEPVC
jgi:hypothetical protein